MNITNPTTFGTPNLTLSTSNSSGTGGALRADDTILVYDTSAVDAITFGQSGNVGSASTASRRDHAHAMASEVVGAYGSVLLNSGNITSTTTSLIDVTGATVTLTTGARPCGYAAAFSWYQSEIDNIQMNVELDGSTLLHGTNGLSFNSHAATFTQNGSFTGQTAALSAASHTILLQWNVNAGTGTITAVSGYTAMWSVWEIV